MAEKLEIIISAKDQFSHTMKSLRSMLPSVKTLAIGAGAAVAGLGTSLFAIANSTAKAGDEFQKMSLRLGLSTELLSGMKHAVELSGSSMESLEKGIRTLAKRMSDADDGLAEAKRSFEDLGINVKNADGSLKDLDTMMFEAAKGLADMEDNTKRVALAQDLFGRSGTQLLPLFKQGADGLRKMTDEAKALGITFDKTGADEAAAFRDNMLRLQKVFTGIKTQIGQALIPLFSEWAAAGAEAGKRVVSYIRQNKAEIQNYAEIFLTAIAKLAEDGAYGIALLIDSFRGLQMIWQILKVAFAEFSLSIINGATKLTEWFDEKMSDFGLTFEKALENAPVDQMTEAFLNIGTAVADLNTQLEDTEKDTKNSGKAVVGFLEDMRKSSQEILVNLIDQGPAIHKATSMMGLMKAAIEEIRAAAKTNGIPPFDDENTETTKKNIKEISDAEKNAVKSLHDMWADYFLTEEQRLTIWYNKQRELFEDNQKLLNELEMVYQAKRQEIKDKQLDDERVWFEKMAEQTKTFAEQTGELITSVFDRVTDGIGNAVAQAIFESENLTEALKSLLRGTTEMVIATLVGIGIRRLVLSMLNITTGVKEQISRMGQLTQQTYASAFAATAAIPIIGPALAPGVASASTAAMLAGSAGAKVAGMAIGGVAHGGIERVSKEQTFLLDQGERVLSPLQNKDLMKFMARKETGEGATIQNLNVHILENAHTMDTLMQLNRKDVERFTEDKILPALRNLKFAGITA